MKYRIDPQVLEVFIAVVKNPTGMYSTILRLPEQVVHETLTTLEIFAGTKLLNKVERGYELTPAGSIVAEYAERLIEVYEEMEQKLSTYPALKRGVISLGVASDFADIHQNYILKFKQQNPASRFRISYGIDEADITSQVVERQINFAIIKNPKISTNKLNGVSFYSEELSDTLWLVWRKDLEIGELEDEFISQFDDRIQ